MHRDGFIVNQIADYSNMVAAFDQVLSGTKRKESRQGRYLLAHKDDVLKELSQKILEGTFRIKDYREITIVEHGKTRNIQVLTMKDRIAINAIMSVVDEHLKHRFIRTTSASIKNRGMHDLMLYIRRDLRDDPIGTKYCYKFDVEKFYESINQDIALFCVRKIFKDKKLITMLDDFIHMMPKGISIGLRSSQGLGNLILSVYLDHLIKDKYAVRYYYRYCDDVVILAKTKTELWEIREIIHSQLQNIGLKVKSNERVFPTTEGIDFLGYIIRPEYVLLRKRIKKNFARKIRTVKSRKRRHELIASYWGMAKHADCINLFEKLTNITMKSFKDLNVSYHKDDGKKQFQGSVVSIRDLQNTKIIVRDFETGIKTEHGEDRCIVSIEVDGVLKKFFTNSDEMKNLLTQISQIKDGFPFETVIKSESIGKGRIKYIFT